MLLTDHERKFLAAFIYEATTDPFKGPATTELHRRDIYYTDLPHLLTAYYRESPPSSQGFGGKHHSTPPPCPWPNRDSAVRRDREVEEELALEEMNLLADEAEEIISRSEAQQDGTWPCH